MIVPVMQETSLRSDDDGQEVKKKKRDRITDTFSTCLWAEKKEKKVTISLLPLC